MRAEHRFQLSQIDVALERMLDLRVEGFVYRAVDGMRLAEFYMALGGVEVAVARYDLARTRVADAYDGAEQHVLGGPSLMARQEMLETEQIPYRGLELVERAGSRIALVAEHHLRPLGAGHRSGARVGKEVDVDLFAPQVEQVVACLANPPVSFGKRRAPDWLYGFHPVWFGPGKVHVFSCTSERRILPLLAAASQRNSEVIHCGVVTYRNTSHAVP